VNHGDAYPAKERSAGACGETRRGPDVHMREMNNVLSINRTAPVGTLPKKPGPRRKTSVS
jgi:hypothetical protein